MKIKYQIVLVIAIIMAILYLVSCSVDTPVDSTSPGESLSSIISPTNSNEPQEYFEQADEYEDYDYTINNGICIITNYYSVIEKDVTVPTYIEGIPVVEIAEEAFNYSNNILSLSFKENSRLTKIGDLAFLGCQNMTDVNLPASLTELGDEIFSACYLLKNINVSKDNTIFHSYNGVLYNADKSEIILYPNYRREVYTIPSTVTTIRAGAFKRSAIGGIVFPENCTISTIPEESFAYCERLTEINIPSSVISLGNSAFASSGLTSIVIPSTITDFGNGIFSNCPLITVELPNDIQVIPNSIFCATLITEIIIPSSVTEIGDSAFMNCCNLSSITLPEGLQTIKYGTFAMSGLTEVIIPSSVTEISKYAFYGCAYLEEIILPQGLTTIGDSAFYMCLELEEISIPDSVTTISAGAFCECSLLHTITFLSTTPPAIVKTSCLPIFDCKEEFTIFVPSESLETYKSDWKSYASYIVAI